MARPKKKVKEVAEQATSEPKTLNDFYSSVYTKVMDDNEKDLELSTGIADTRAISTGLLVLDLVSGGIRPGWFSMAGPEGSAKSASTMATLKACIRDRVPVIKYFDAENAVEGEYSGRILGVKDINREVWGVRAGKNKGWLVPPKARYYDTEILEKVFKSIQSQLLELPDKKFRAEDGKWYLIFDRDRDSVNRMREMQKNGLPQHDKTLYTETKRYWCCVEDDDRLQAAFFVDSFPALLAEEIAEMEKEGNNLSVEAAGFSKWVKRVKGKLRRKRALVWGVNQLREKPMAKGNPFYEPCGNALKFYSDVRNWLWATSPNTACKEIGFRFEETEPSVYKRKAKDIYHYKRLTNNKNKFGMPNLKAWMRIWVSDHNGLGWGFDPVFDTYWYLRMTKQLGGKNKRDSFKIDIKGLDDIEYNWETFKMTILSVERNDKAMQALVKEGFGIKKIPKIREVCFGQIKDKSYINLMMSDKEDSTDADDDLEIEDEDDE